MITRQEALDAVRRAGCSEQVVEHLLAVERTALSIAKKVQARGHKIDLKRVRLGSLLHDIGRAKTHGIAHGVEGGKILKEMGLDDFVAFAERHIGAGLPAAEAKELGLPARALIPKTIEEKVVTYADKLVMGNRRVSYKRAFEMFRDDLGRNHPALKRFENLHKVIERLSVGTKSS